MSLHSQVDRCGKSLDYKVDKGAMIVAGWEGWRRAASTIVKVFPELMLSWRARHNGRVPLLQRPQGPSSTLLSYLSLNSHR